MFSKLKAPAVVKDWLKGPRETPFFIDRLQAALAHDSQQLQIVKSHVDYVSDVLTWSPPHIQQQRQLYFNSEVKPPLVRDLKRIERVANFTKEIGRIGFTAREIGRLNVDPHAIMRDVRRRIHDVSTLLLTCISMIDSLSPDVESQPGDSGFARKLPAKPVPWSLQEIGKESVQARIQHLDVRLIPRPKEPEYKPKLKYNNDTFKDICRECYLEEECLCSCRDITELVHIVVVCKKCREAVEVKESAQERGKYRPAYWREHARRERMENESDVKKAPPQA